MDPFARGGGEGLRIQGWWNRRGNTKRFGVLNRGAKLGEKTDKAEIHNLLAKGIRIEKCKLAICLRQIVRLEPQKRRRGGFYRKKLRTGTPEPSA